MKAGLMLGCLALVATGCLSEQADAKRRYAFSSGKSRSGRARGYWHMASAEPLTGDARAMAGTSASDLVVAAIASPSAATSATAFELSGRSAYKLGVAFAFTGIGC